MKPIETGFRPKARLVARGFEEEELNKSEKESPTCSKDTFRTILGLTVQNNWNIQAIDIKTACLQGEHIDRNIFVIPPHEANCPKEHIWKLNKCTYSLSDASLK